MTKNSFTIFGQGFVGTNISIFLKKKKYKLFIPKKGIYKFKKNLHNVIYCIGNQNWLKDPKVTYNANLGLVPEIFLIINLIVLLFYQPRDFILPTQKVKLVKMIQLI